MPSKVTPAIIVLLLAVTATTAAAQGLPPPPAGRVTSSQATPTTSGPSAYDVASIHEHAGDDRNMRWMNKEDGMSTENLPLRSLISSAYNIKMDLISGGPSWVYTKGFDLTAKVLPGDGAAPVKLTPGQQRALLLALLTDRFHLKAHIESKMLPVYDLTVAKGGPRMPLVPPQPGPDEVSPGDFKPGDLNERGSASFEPGHIRAHAYGLTNLAENLGYIVQRTVHDKTGLTGEYDIDLSWTPEDELQAASDKATGADLRRPSGAARPEARSFEGLC